MSEKRGDFFSKYADHHIAKYAAKICGNKKDNLIDALPVEKRHLSKLIIICRIKLTGD